MQKLNIHDVPNLLKKDKYDCIFSMGGSCTAAFQLKFRNLRKEALPFDWLYYKDCNTINKLSLCFKEDFKNWLKIENMCELAKGEGIPNNNLQYEDLYTGYRFIHDFKKSFEQEFPIIEQKYKRRINRLYDKIKISNNILLVLDTPVSVDFESLIDLKNTLNDKWVNKNFEIVAVQYSSTEENIIYKDDIYIIHTCRSECDYDYKHVMYEFAFLDKYEKKDVFKNMVKTLFSVQNVRKNNNKYKQIIFLGIKFNIKH